MAERYRTPESWCTLMPLTPGQSPADCVQRAFAPAGQVLIADDLGESLISYRFEPR